MKSKKIMALVLCLCMLLASIPFTVLAATPDLTPTYIEGTSASTFATGTCFILSNEDGTGFFGGSSPASYSIQKSDIAGKSVNVIRTTDTVLTYLIKLNDGTYKIAVQADAREAFVKAENDGGTIQLRETTLESEATAWQISYDTASQKYTIINSNSIDDADNDYYLSVYLKADSTYGLQLSTTSSYLRIFAASTSFIFLNADGSVYEHYFGEATAPEYTGAIETGYNFVGWSTDPDGNGAIVKPGATINPAEPEVYYPIFKGITYEIRFFESIDYVGTSKYVSQEMTYGETQALRKNTFTKSHNDFAYWTMYNWTNPRGIGTGTFADEEKVSDLSFTQGEVIFLYATWEEYSYTVLYSANGADTTEVASPATYTYSRVFRLSDSADMAKDGYRFAGWNTKADGTGDMYSAGQPVSRLCEEKDGKVTLFATWVKDSEYCDHTVNEKGTVTKQATCTETGTIEYRCTKCGDLLNSETIPALGHGHDGEYEIIHKDTTCNRAGINLYICKACDTPYRSVAVDAAGHVAGIPETSVQATCTKAGIKVTKCNECGAILQETEIPKLGHTVSTNGIVTKQATCTEVGTIEYRCTDCDVLVKQEEIPALGHGSNGEYKIVHKDTTCNKGGIDLYICKICNMPYRSEAVDKAGHVEGTTETLVQATCTKTGIQVTKCTECGVTLSETVVPKLEHTKVTVTEKQATCSQTGLKIEKCSICNAVISETQIPKTEHIPGVWKITKDCTCTEDGFMQQSCSVCGALIGDPKTLNAHEHQAGAWETSIKPTCTTEGERVKICTVCNAVVESEAIAKTEHTKGQFLIEKAATCTEAGLKVQKCETCGIVLADEEIAAKGHHEGSYYLTVDKPSCNNAGERVYYCDVCGTPVRTEAVEKRGHVEGAWVTTLEPTCTRKGHQKKFCEVCNVTLDERDVDAAGHTEGVWITTLEPTCVTAGERVCNCDTCGKAYKSERLDPLGHTPGPEETCVDDQICLVCYVVLEKADGRSHTWSEWATYEEAGYFTERVERRFCTSCNQEEFRYVSGTAGCHNCFPHSDDPDNCGACNVLHSVNSFFRSVGKVLTFIFFGNIGTNVLFPWLHTHFHNWFNPYK